MNAQVNTVLDKSTPALSSAQVAASKVLNLFMTELNIQDVWRVHNPSLKDSTFFSARHITFSRIDNILVLSGWLVSVNSVEFLPRLISDHNPVLSTLNYSSIKNRASR